jgi:CBS domain containing-hemolysin-like protein
VIGPNKKEVVGVLYSKDLLRTKLNHHFAEASIASLMRKPHFVQGTMKVNSLFRTFKKNKTHMAIVKNRLGEITGVVTMSDILDELFEDLFTDSESAKHSHFQQKLRPRNA